MSKEYDQLTVKELKELFDVKRIPIPKNGSGKNGSVVKSDLVAALETFDKTYKHTSSVKKNVKIKEKTSTGVNQKPSIVIIEKKFYSIHDIENGKTIDIGTTNQINSDIARYLFKQNQVINYFSTIGITINKPEDIYMIIKNDLKLRNRLLTDNGIEIREHVVPQKILTIINGIKNTFFNSLNPKYRKILEKETDGGEYIINLINSFFRFDAKGNMIEYHLYEEDAIDITELLINFDNISGNFHIEYSEGHMLKPNDPKYLPDFDSAIQEKNRSSDNWEEEVKEKLANIDDTYKFPFIDYDNNYEFQEIILILNNSPEHPYEQSDEESQ